MRQEGNTKEDFYGINTQQKQSIRIKIEGKNDKIKDGQSREIELSDSKGNQKEKHIIAQPGTIKNKQSSIINNIIQIKKF